MPNTTLTQTGAEVQEILDKAEALPSSLGTAGQVLTVNSGATGAEWQTPQSGGVSSIGGATGAITLGSGLQIQGQTLSATGGGGGSTGYTLTLNHHSSGKLVILYADNTYQIVNMNDYNQHTYNNVIAFMIEDADSMYPEYQPANSQGVLIIKRFASANLYFEYPEQGTTQGISCSHYCALFNGNVKAIIYGGGN